MVIRDKDLQRVYHVLLYCARIRMTVRDIEDYAAFITSENFVQRDACCFYLLQIGELARTLSDSFKDVHDDIPWKQIRGLRNMVAHNYGHVDFEIIWSIVQDDIPVLFEKLHAILNESVPAFEKSFCDELRQEYPMWDDDEKNTP